MASLPWRIFRPFPQNRQVALIGEDPASLTARDLATMSRSSSTRSTAATVGAERPVRRARWRMPPAGTFDQGLVHAQCRTRTPSQAADSRAVVADRFADGPGRGDPRFRDLTHTLQEEPQPGFPITGVPDVAQKLVVGAPIAFEVQAEVQKRLPEQSGVAQHEGDQQSSQPPVAVEEGMDGLELDVRKPGPDQHGKFVVRGVNEPLEVGHAFLDMVGRWRDEGRIAGARPADPVL